MLPGEWRSLAVATSMVMLERGFEIDVLDLLATDAELDAEEYLQRLPVRRLRSADRLREDFWELDAERIARVDDYDVVLVFM